jgi:UDP-glucose 6-dehydrogenase
MKNVTVRPDYVALTTGAGSAFWGGDVCVDMNEERVSNLGQGKIPNFEPEFSDLIADMRATGGPRFSSDPASGVESAGFMLAQAPDDLRRENGAVACRVWRDAAASPVQDIGD